MTRETAVQELFDVKRKLQRKVDTPNLEAKDEVYEEYRPYFQPENIGDIKEHEIISFLDYKNNRHWTGLLRSKNKITRSMEDLRNGLSTLVDETRPLAPRFTEAIDKVYGMGTAIATAVLHVAHPGNYGVWNNTSEGVMKKLDLWPDFEYGSTVGEKYEKVNRVLVDLAEELDTDLWTLDALWHWHTEFDEEDEEEISETDTGESVQQQFGLEKHLQEFLRDNWEETDTLGTEWKLFEDETGPGVRYEYQTSVGRIDLLAEHKEEDRWLVIELKRDQISDATVGQVLRYIGAVRKEVADEGDQIEGLIIAREATDRLRYALDEVPQVSLRRYEVDFRLLPE